MEGRKEGADSILELLSEQERCLYQQIVRWLKMPGYAPRYTGAEEFIKQLRVINQFAIARPERRFVRSLACGIFFLPRSLMVHTQRLSMTLGRSKSSVNQELQRSGFSGAGRANEMRDIFARILPDVQSGRLRPTRWALRVVEDAERANAFLSAFTPVADESVLEGIIGEDETIVNEPVVTPVTRDPIREERVCEPPPVGCGLTDLRRLLNRPELILAPAELEGGLAS